MGIISLYMPIPDKIINRWEFLKKAQINVEFKKVYLLTNIDEEMKKRDDTKRIIFIKTA